MIKGKTEIVLTDVHTGRSQKILEHNMMTNALNEIFKQEGYMKDESYMYGDAFSPPYATALGGILLFDKAIPENVSTYFAPAGTNLTACGVYGIKNTTADTLRGDFNTEESVVDRNARSVKYVYDFATSKGNGTIASVCLTSLNGGYSSYGALAHSETDQRGRFFLRTARRDYLKGNDDRGLIAVDYTNDQVITFTPSTNGQYINAITIYKRHGYMKTLSFLDYSDGTARIISEKTISIDNIYSGGYGWNYDKTANTFYLVGKANTNCDIPSGGTFRVIAISLDTLTARTYNLTNPSDGTLYADNTYVYDDYVYLANSKRDKMCRIRLTDDSDFTEISALKEYAFFYMRSAFDLEGRIYIPSYGGSNYPLLTVIDTSTNTVRTAQIYHDASSGGRHSIPVLGSDIMRYDLTGSSVNYFCVPCNYLATINNLSAPVKKTAAQTMKVIYTITEA
ncbi:hypothetical protein [uncultured Ruminococcus sp.]|uniref:hypothetical protein n=1 Tax=uncultured Ruminococcus sp. TaxID=165186 RepID=UPI0025ECC477|nr:hypothetical protein [uncultured Ruminococcus sp.]